MKYLKRIGTLSLMTLFFSSLLSGIQAMNEAETAIGAISEIIMIQPQVIERESNEGQANPPGAMMLGAMALVEALEEGTHEIKLSVDDDFDAGNLHGYARMLYPEYYSLNWTTQGGIAHIRAVFSQPEQMTEAKRLAKELVDDSITEWMTTSQKLRILHDLLAGGCQYDYETAANPQESGVSAFTAYGALVEGLAVCDGYTAAYALLCNEAGIPCVAVFSAEMNHSWNAVLCDGEVLYIDVTFDDTAGLWDADNPDYFLAPREVLQVTHIWNAEETEQLLGMAARKAATENGAKIPY